MTNDYALDFLKKHQPMKNDDELTFEIINIYDNIREFFLINKDSRCIPLFLNSFGYISGLGVYQLVENTIVVYNDFDVILHLIKSINSNYYSVRYWSVIIANNYKDSRLFDGLIKNLRNKFVCSDIRFFAFTALSKNIKNAKIKKILNEEYIQEPDLEIKDCMKEILFENR